ncbi:MAG: PH domain-containing protein [Dehalococcoidia bacterium]
MSAVRSGTNVASHNPFIAVLGRILFSAIIALPFGLGGYYLVDLSGVPEWAPLALMGIGAVLGVIGLYMSFMANFPTPKLVPDEEALVVRHPTMKPAYARIMLSIPFFLGSAYLFLFSELPYIYPFLLLLVGLLLFFKGAMRYWANLHVTYTVTNRRVINMYRFLWLRTTEIPVTRIISISEARSFFELMTGRGSVVVASGIGARQTIRIEDISDPGPVGEVLRSLLPYN